MFTEEQLKFMQMDIDSGMAISKFVDIVKKKFAEEGRDFQKEFDEWKKNKDENK